MTPEERFWSKVDRTGECWRWTASRTSAGYGKASTDGRLDGAHRIAWRLAYGAIPDGMWVLHHCDNPPCVRPEHLFLGTHRDNMADARAKGRLSPTIFNGTQVRLMSEGRARRPESHARGERSGAAKLTEAQVREIRSRVAAGASQSAVARDYGVVHQLVNSIVRGRIWRHVA